MLARRDPRSRYLQREVRAYAPYWRRASDEVAPRSLEDFAEFGPDLVLRPDVAAVYAGGSRRLAARTMWARLWGGQQRVNDRVLIPRYKPVLWVEANGVPVGYSAADVQRLGRIGAHWFRDAGVTADDVLVSVLPPGPNLAWWQVVTGARAARLSAMHLGAGAGVDDVARLRPSVVVGRPLDLLRLTNAGLSGMRLVLAVDQPLGGPVGRPLDAPPDRPLGRPLDRPLDAPLNRPLDRPLNRPLDAPPDRPLDRPLDGPLDDGLRARLSAAAGVPVLNAWAPPGVRALWGECAGGAATGLHTSADSEVVELIDPRSGEVVAPGSPGGVAVPGSPGEVVWSPVGWRGTVMLRLRTGVFATVDAADCPVCGRAGPRLFPIDPLTALDDEPAVLEWRAERRVVDGAEELIVHLAVDPDVELEPLLRRLDTHLHATQFVVAT